MTLEEYNSIKFSEDYELIKSLDAEINKELRIRSCDGINRCNSYNEVQNYIKAKVIPFIDINKLRK